MQIRLLLRPGPFSSSVWSLVVKGMQKTFDDSTKVFGGIHFEQANWGGDLSSSTVQLVYTPQKQFTGLSQAQCEYLNTLYEYKYIRTWRVTDSTSIVDRMEAHSA